ncbi:MAG: dTDP-4-dehydrorhamnose reductase [Mucilaginibacter sp.]
MDNTIVFGASGQLGHCIQHLVEKNKIDGVFFPSETEANILDNSALKRVFEAYKPAYIINCAAYTAVEKAEDEQEIALKVNKTGVENLSRFCDEYESVFIHISTDFVFNGDVSMPRNEDSETAPVNVYGQTKLDGERVIEALLQKYFIVRTGWLYSEYGNNFVKTMLNLGAERDELKVIADQAGTPTYAMDLAACLLLIIQSRSTAYGIYHYSNEGIASWYDFAKAIFESVKARVKVIPVRADEYVTKAKRPAYSVMDKSKIKTTFNMEIPYWRDSLITCIKKLKNN